LCTGVHAGERGETRALQSKRRAPTCRSHLDCFAHPATMDVFCRCTGCGSCNSEAALAGGGECGNNPQKYTINAPGKIPPVRHGKGWPHRPHPASKR
jgi:hypothetical protein